VTQEATTSTIKFEADALDVADAAAAEQPPSRICCRRPRRRRDDARRRSRPALRRLQGDEPAVDTTSGW
jgi:hypothetical protein